MVALSSKGFKQCGAYCWWLLCCANKFICNHCRIKCQPPVTWPLSPSWPSCLQRKEAVLCCLAASPLRRSWRDPTFSGDQLSYICSFSFILNGSYHIVHGNGTKLLVHGPLELTKSCFHLNLNLTCQVLVPDVDTSDSRDIAFLGWRGALNGEHLSGDSRQLLRKDGRMLLRSQISVATIHSQGTYTCWLHKGGHLLAQKSIQVGMPWGSQLHAYWCPYTSSQCVPTEAEHKVLVCENRDQATTQEDSFMHWQPDGQLSQLMNAFG
ncbi:hypothetical protein GN956_G4398 [Arapaima gigas]